MPNGELFWINTVIGHLFHGIPGAYYRPHVRHAPEPATSYRDHAR